MSLHAFHFGLRVDILDEKSWSRVRFEPLTSDKLIREHFSIESDCGVKFTKN